MVDVELLPCGECGMPCRAGEYHPFAACLMFKACHNSETVRANLAPLQAENERLRAEHDALRAEYYRVLHALQDEQARADRLAERDALLEACCLAARYLNPDQFPDAVKKIDAAIAAANGGGNG